MVEASFLSTLGLFVIDNFLRPEECRVLRQAIKSTSADPAKVVDGGNNVLDQEMRRTYDHNVDDETRSQVHTKLMALKPQLENHFGVKLTGCTQPRFLAYRIGDFFRRHPDNSMRPALPEVIKSRQVSVVLFLNDNDEEADRPETFSGGTLNFYGLFSDSRLRDRSIPLKCKGGLLVAFRSDLDHEVRPITRGERYSIVAWFS